MARLSFLEGSSPRTLSSMKAAGNFGAVKVEGKAGLDTGHDVSFVFAKSLGDGFGGRIEEC